MSVVVDDETLPVDEMGLRTVGQVLAHLQKENRLVVHVLIDGQEPDLAHLPSIKRSPINGHTLYIETAEPRRMAMDVLREVDQQLDEADRLRSDAVELLQTNAPTKAMEKLSGCFTTWSHAEESLRKVAQLLRVDLSRIVIDDQSFTEVLHAFADLLRNIKDALENRDFVALSDALTYEAIHTTAQWKRAIAAMRAIVEN